MDFKILSIETSGNNCSIALTQGNKIVSSYSINQPNIHDELAATLIKRILADNQITVQDLSAVAISSGPGSFTGLRIGASLAKGLCFSMNNKNNSPKLIAVPTLMSFINFALKYKNILKTENIVSVIAAQKDIIYYQEYQNNEFSEVKIGHKNDLNDDKYNSFLKIGPYFSINNEFDFLNEYSADKIAYSAITLFHKSEFTDPEKFTPDYIQEFEVKTKKKELNI